MNEEIITPTRKNWHYLNKKYRNKIWFVYIPIAGIFKIYKGKQPIGFCRPYEKTEK